MSQFHQKFITSVIDLYGLELDGHQADTLIVTWLQKYDPAWIVKAIVESLYRGRYKIKSVDNILKDWQRLGKPRHNFTPDYEREILQNLPDPAHLAAMLMPLTSSLPVVYAASLEHSHSSSQFAMNQPSSGGGENLNPEESAPFGRHLHSSTAQLDTYSVGDAVVVAATREYLPATGTIDPEHCSMAGLLPQLQFQGDPVGVADLPNREFPMDTPAHRSNSEPVNHHLFATLKAIVDPHHQRNAGVSNSVTLPRYVLNPNPHQIEQFKLAIEHLNEEQCL